MTRRRPISRNRGPTPRGRSYPTSFSAFFSSPSDPQKSRTPINVASLAEPDLVDPMDALARLQLARALALSGDIVNAKSAYGDLFTLWKNADADIPVLKATRAEYARLP